MVSIQEIRRRKKEAEERGVSVSQVPLSEEAKTEKRRQEGQQFIATREKLRSQGVGKREATSAAIQESQASQAQDIQEQRQAQGIAFVEEQGVAQEEVPLKKELDIQKGAGEDLAAIGGSIGAIKSLLTKGKAFIPGVNVDKDFIINADPETAREAAFQTIERSVYQEGLTQNERFGAFIEAIPFVGDKIGRFAGGLIETPSENAETAVQNIRDLRERAANMAEWSQTGKISPYVAIGQLNDMEENLIRLEARFKLLIQFSATLRSNADEINRIEDEILRTKERIFEAKQVAAAGAISVPSDASVYLTLQKIKSNSRANSGITPIK